MKLEQVVACMNLLTSVIRHVKTLLSTNRMQNRAAMMGRDISVLDQSGSLRLRLG
jgi:hypothetical protein